MSRYLIAVFFLLGTTACDSRTGEESDGDMTAENIAVVRHQLEEMDAGNLDVFDELCAQGYRYHAPGVPEPLTCEEHKESAREFYTAFSDFGHTVEDIVAVGDRVVVRLIDFGTHTGNFAGLPATGNAVRFSVIAINRLENGKIAETWITADFPTLLQQLGSVPPGLLGEVP